MDHDFSLAHGSQLPKAYFLTDPIAKAEVADLPDSNSHGQDRWMHATLWLLRSFGRLGKLDQNCLSVVLDCCIGLRGEVHAQSVPIVDTHDAENPMLKHSWKNAHSSSNC